MHNTSVLCTSFSSRSSWATFSASAAGTDTAAARGPEAAKAVFGESAEDTDSAAAGAADIVELIFADFDAEAKELYSHGHEETSESRPARSDRGGHHLYTVWDLIFATGLRGPRAAGGADGAAGPQSQPLGQSEEGGTLGQSRPTRLPSCFGASQGDRRGDWSFAGAAGASP